MRERTTEVTDCVTLLFECLEMNKVHPNTAINALSLALVVVCAQAEFKPKVFNDLLSLMRKAYKEGEYDT